MPVMESSLGIRKSSAGLFLTCTGALWSFKVCQRFLGDRANARVLMEAAGHVSHP